MVKRWRLGVFGAVFSAGVALTVAGQLPSAGTARAQPTRPLVLVAPIEGMIDLGVAPFTQRVLAEATRVRAAAVIFEINTFGGRVDAAIIVRDALLAAEVPTVVFINRRAISAGALIALAAGRIAITDGGTIGAAMPVQAGAPGAPSAPVEEKTVSYVRKEFRATAESRKRPLEIAEAMVDADVVIEGLIEAGKLLTLTTDEALAHGVADFRAANIDAVLAELDLAGAEIRRAEVNWAEQIVRLLTNPVVSSLLLSVGLLGILVEIRTPGVGVPGIAGLTSLALFLGGHWIVRLAGWEELLLVALGGILLLVEVFVIPGFGIAGVAGIGALLGGLTLTLLGEGASAQAISGAVVRVIISLVAALVAGLLLMRVMTRTPLARRLVLDTDMDATEGWESTPAREHRLIGAEGCTHTALRPAGIADIGGERVDVVSDGEMIDPGTPIVVTRVDGNRVVVRRVSSTMEQG
jgi:membrane-bound serine protease (ClpP class)